MSKPATDARLAAEAKGFTQVIGRGNASLITKDPSTGKCCYDGQVGGGWHYNGAQETDTAWEADSDQNYLKMVKAGYNLRARKLFNAGDLIQWTDPVSGQYVKFQPQNFQWIDGSETVTFSAAGTKQTTTTLTANSLPTVTTANLNCNILIECLDTGGAPIYAETTTAIKVRHEPELVTVKNPEGNWTTYNGYVMVRNSTITLGDKTRINSTDYHAKRIEPQSWLDGTETYRIVYF